MADNPNLIKVGLTADVQSFVKEVKKELASVKGLGLSDAIKDEIKDIEAMLDGLAKSFSDGMDMKLDTKTFAVFEQKISKDMQAIDKRVTTLEDSMQALVTTMDAADSGKMTSFLEEVGSKMQLLDGFTAETVKTMRELMDIVSKSGGTIKFADNSDVKVLESEIVDLKKIQDLVNAINNDKNIGSKSLPLNNVAKAAKQINDTYDRLIDVQNEYNKALDSADDTTITRIQKKYVETYSELEGLRAQFQTLYPAEEDKDYVKNIAKTLYNARDIIDEFANRATERIGQVSRSLNSLGQSSAISMDKEKTTIKVPMEISTTGRGLGEKARRIIETAQNTIKDTPLKVDFALQSKYSSKKTNELLKEWQNQIGEIDNPELREKFSNLYDVIAKDFQKEIKLKVSSNIYDEEVKVKKVIERIKKLVGQKIHIFPEFDIKDVDIAKLQKKVDQIAKKLKLNVDLLPKDAESQSNKQLDALNTLAETLSTKLDNLNKNYLSPIKKSLADILSYAQILKDSTVQTDAPIDELVTSVKDLTVAFQQAFGIFEKEDVDGIFERIQKSVKGIRGSLEGGAENPLVSQLQEILSLYKEYQRLGGTKLLSDAGGTKKVQKWLADNYVEEKAFIGKEYVNGLQDSLPIVKEKAKELPKAAISAIEELQNSGVVEEIGKEFSKHFAKGIISGTPEVKNATEKVVKDILGNEINILDGNIDYSKILASFSELSKKGQKERGAYASFRSGDISDLIQGADNYISGDVKRAMYESIGDELKAIIDTFIHSHPDKYAAFSIQDFSSAINELSQGIINQIVISFKEIAMLDMSKIDDSKLRKVEKDFAVNYLKQIDKSFSVSGSVIQKKDYNYVSSLLAQKIQRGINIFFEKNHYKGTENLDFADEINKIVEDYLHSLKSNSKVSVTSISDYVSKAISSILKDKWDLSDQSTTVLRKGLNAEYRKGFPGFLGKGISGIDNASYRKEMARIARESLMDALESNDVKDAYKVASIDDFIARLSSANSYKEVFDNLPKYSEQTTQELDLIDVSAKNTKESVDKLGESISQVTDNREVNTNPFQNVEKGADETAQAIAQIIANAEKLEKVDSPLTKRNFNSLKRASTNKTREDAGTAKNILDYTKLYMQSGQTEILKVIKDYVESSNLKDTLKGSLIRTFTSAIEAAEKATVAESKFKSQTQTQIMNKKQYAEYMRKYAPWKNSDEFNYNLDRSIEELQKRGLASRKTTKSGKLGAWEIQVEVPINQLEKLEKKEKEVEEQTTKTSKASNELAQSNDKITQSSERQEQADKKISKSLQEKIDKYQILKQRQQEILSQMSAMATSSNGNIGNSEEYKNLKDEETSVSAKMQQLVEKAFNNNKANLLELVGLHRNVTQSIEEQTNAEVKANQISSQSSEQISKRLKKYIDQYKELEKKRNEILSQLTPKFNEETGQYEKPENYKDLWKQLNDINLSMQSKSEKVFKQWHKNLRTLATDYSNLADAANLQIDNGENSSLGGTSSETANQVDKAADAINREGNEAQKGTKKKQKLAKAEKDLSKASKDAADSTDSAADAIEKEYKNAEKNREKVLREEQKIRNAIAEAPRKEAENMLSSLDTQKFNKNFTSSFSSEIDDLRAKIVNLLSSDNIDVSALDAIKRKFADLDKTVSNSKSASQYILAEETSISGMQAKITGFLEQNTAMSRKFKRELKDLYNTLENGGEITTAQLKEIGTRFNKITAQVRMLHQTGQSFASSFVKQLKSANAQLIATYFSFQDLIRYAREGFQTVVEVDTALTELRKVSDASDERLAESFKQSTITAKELGSTISDVIGVTADWARLGYDVDQAEELARVTTLFKTVGDNMSAEDTSSYMVSTLQGFQMTTDQAMEIADKFNEVDICLQS